MKISYAITACNEINELQRLISQLLENKRDEDEIIVVYDANNGSEAVNEYLRAQNVTESKFLWYPYSFEGHFADLKNYLTSKCSGDYIFQIDADETLHPVLLTHLPEILESNSDVEVFRVPRVNTVEGLTQEHIQKWRWGVNEKGWVNWPDYQFRIYKNNGNIAWKNKVHEVLVNYTKISYLPMQEEFSLYHPKTIERQEKQNNYYDTL